MMLKIRLWPMIVILGATKRGKLWLLTGPNMGGKSTFLRQNALIIILAQMGSFCTGKNKPTWGLSIAFSAVSVLLMILPEDVSTFMVEMVETAAILNQAEVKIICNSR